MKNIGDLEDRIRFLVLLLNGSYEIMGTRKRAEFKIYPLRQDT